MKTYRQWLGCGVCGTSLCNWIHSHPGQAISTPVLLMHFHSLSTCWTLTLCPSQTKHSVRYSCIPPLLRCPICHLLEFLWKVWQTAAAWGHFCWIYCNCSSLSGLCRCNCNPHICTHTLNQTHVHSYFCWLSLHPPYRIQCMIKLLQLH